MTMRLLQCLIVWQKWLLTSHFTFSIKEASNEMIDCPYHRYRIRQYLWAGPLAVTLTAAYLRGRPAACH
jgi:hypothetical protein